MSDSGGHGGNYKIGQAAELLGVKPYVLRFWESEFPQIQPRRSSTGQRVYDDDSLHVVRRVKYLLYDEGLTIEGARKRLEEDDRAGVLAEVEAELRGIRAMLAGESPGEDASGGTPAEGGQLTLWNGPGGK
ncbi:MerR family transcriptional regulator [Desulfohalovibrio reitneri]|uniref:MerR family transcriptional regulator n=1 Tax=Desulfohalovibrio reitneri TaxID=1307759 RepID=UPI0009DE0F21